MPVLTWTGTRFVYVCNPGDYNVPRALGFHYDGNNRFWWTGLLSVAKGVQMYADGKATAKFNEESDVVKQSWAKDANISIPAPDGLAYLPFQKGGVAYAARRSRTLIADEMGLGKAQPLDAKLLTPTGWVLMKDISVGDEVINEEGVGCKVTGVHPQGEKEIFEVVFTDGSRTECCAEHLWFRSGPDQRWWNRKYGKNRGSVRSLADLMTRPLTDRFGNLKHFIPISKPVQFKSSEPLPLHPYILGYMLGDGCLKEGGTLEVSCYESEILSRLKELLPVGLQKIGSTEDYRICDKAVEKSQRSSTNPVTKVFRELGLTGKLSHQKFIPLKYQLASIEDREELIRGLLDADGYRDKIGGVDFNTTSEQLALDTKFVLESLGCSVRVHLDEHTWFTYKGIKKQGKPCYRLRISPRKDFEPFWLPRKRYNKLRKYLPYRGIKSISYAGKKVCQCISVDSKTGLYLTDDCIVTHNTIQALGVINLFPEIKNILIIPPASLRLNWGKEIKKWVVRDLSGAYAHGSSFPDTNIVIINYDIVRRFRKQIDARRWDLLICDEAHYLKNTETKRTQSVMGYTYYGKPMEPAIDAGMKLYLTGTPILSRPIELWPIVHDCDPAGLGVDQWLFAERYCKPWEPPWGGLDMSGHDNLDELQERLRGTCFPAEVNILCEHGTTTIGELISSREEVKVWSSDEMGNIELRKVVGFREISNTKGLVKVVHEMGELTCTPDHLIFVQGKGYTRAKDIRGGDRLLTLQKEIQKSNNSGIRLQVLHNNLCCQGKAGGIIHEDGSDSAWATPGSSKEDLSCLFRRVSSPLERKDKKNNLFRQVPSKEEIRQAKRSLNKSNALSGSEGFSGSKTSWKKESPNFSQAQGQDSSFRTKDELQQRAETSLAVKERTDGARGRSYASDPCSKETLTKENEPSAQEAERSFEYRRPLGRFPNYSAKYAVLGRLVSAGSENNHRSRWFESYRQAISGKRQETRPTPTESRVLSVEILGMGSGREFRNSIRENQNVYDIEVEGNHNFFAEGVLVHNCMIRRLKKDVLTELPPKRRQVIAIPPEAARAAVKEELAYYLQHQQEIDKAIAETEMFQAAGDDESFKGAIRKMEGESPTFFTMARLRLKTGLAKIPFIKEFLDDVLQQEQKVVVFAHHREVVSELYKYYGPKIAVMMHGDKTTAERQWAVDRFQQDPNIRVIIGTIGTMKEGWTLTKASYCLFCEMDWVPAIISQSEDRLHRITQVEPVLVHHFCFDGSLDAYMAQVIVRKQEIIDQALNVRRAAQ